MVRAQQPRPDQFEPIGPIQKVRDNLYMIPGQGGNTAVFVTGTGIVLVDTKLVNNGKAILERVASVSKLPITTIINTHSHFDHIGEQRGVSGHGGRGDPREHACGDGERIRPSRTSRRPCPTGPSRTA
jgi:alkyl sulfatase BDS1-like metallo-beta-lactamase superfamily hydrolase